MRSILSLIFFRLAVSLHGKCKESDLYASSPVFAPDGSLTPKFSQRTCRICGCVEEFPWNRYQYAFERVKSEGQYCELCGDSSLGLKAIPWGSVARITTTCRKCREAVAVAV
jgi:hypothetical protein